MIIIFIISKEDLKAFQKDSLKNLIKEESDFKEERHLLTDEIYELKVLIIPINSQFLLEIHFQIGKRDRLFKKPKSGFDKKKCRLF